MRLAWHYCVLRLPQVTLGLLYKTTSKQTRQMPSNVTICRQRGRQLGATLRNPALQLAPRSKVVREANLVRKLLWNQQRRPPGVGQEPRAKAVWRAPIVLKVVAKEPHDPPAASPKMLLQSQVRDSFCFSFDSIRCWNPAVLAFKKENETRVDSFGCVFCSSVGLLH